MQPTYCNPHHPMLTLTLNFYNIFIQQAADTPAHLETPRRIVSETHRIVGCVRRSHHAACTHRTHHCIALQTPLYEPRNCISSFTVNSYFRCHLCCRSSTASYNYESPNVLNFASNALDFNKQRPSPRPPTRRVLHSRTLQRDSTSSLICRSHCFFRVPARYAAGWRPVQRAQNLFWHQHTC